jgi:hypothetical protein
MGRMGASFSNTVTLRAEWTEPKSATAEQEPCCHGP